jgi:hypothetical protein
VQDEKTLRAGSADIEVQDELIDFFSKQIEGPASRANLIKLLWGVLGLSLRAKPQPITVRTALLGLGHEVDFSRLHFLDGALPLAFLEGTKVPSRSVGIKSARIEPKLYGCSNPIELAANRDLIAMPLLETEPVGRLALLRLGRNCKTALQNQATCDVDSPTVHP